MVQLTRLFFSLCKEEALPHASLLKKALSDLEIECTIGVLGHAEGGVKDRAEYARKLDAADLVIFFGTRSFGGDDLLFVVDERKPFLLLKMCARFDEPLTRLLLNSTEPYVLWPEKDVDGVPETLLAKLLETVELLLPRKEEDEEQQNPYVMTKAERKQAETLATSSASQESTAQEPKKNDDLPLSFLSTLVNPLSQTLEVPSKGGKGGKEDIQDASR